MVIDSTADFRIFPIFETKKKYICKDFAGNICIVKKNKNLKYKMQKGRDYTIYAKFKINKLFRVLIPVSDIEAGVVQK